MGERARTDAELIVASTRDPKAFGLLFDRHVRAIHRFAWRRLGSMLANDITSETFTVAFARRGDFDPARGDVLPWLFGIATNVMRNHRRAERRQLLSAAVVEEDAREALEAVEDQIDAESAFRKLAQSLAGMHPGDRDTLLLFAWTDLGYEGIAEALGIPPGTVGSRLDRGRRILRAALDDAGWSSNDESAKEA
jgi:RNA polymerase sigma-70 factor, ECF subfamily